MHYLSNNKLKLKFNSENKKPELNIVYSRPHSIVRDDNKIIRRLDQFIDLSALSNRLNISFKNKNIKSKLATMLIFNKNNKLL